MKKYHNDKPTRKIFLFLGEIIKRPNGKWHITDFDDTSSTYGLVGNRLRVIAASVAYHNGNISSVVALGGRGVSKNILDSPHIADLCEKELIALGVPVNAIVKEIECGTTYEQLIAVEKMLAGAGVLSGILISNTWHLPRIRAMIEYFPNLTLLKEALKTGEIKLTAAEEILISGNFSAWKEKILATQKGAIFKKIVSQESKGVEDIQKGTYRL